MNNKTNNIIASISSLIFLAVLCLPFYFLSFWWAVLVDYTILITLLGLFIYGATKQDREYEEMIERETRKMDGNDN